MLEKRGHYLGVPRVASKLQIWGSNLAAKAKTAHFSTPPCNPTFDLQNNFPWTGGGNAGRVSDGKRKSGCSKLRPESHWQAFAVITQVWLVSWHFPNQPSAHALRVIFHTHPRGDSKLFS